MWTVWLQTKLQPKATLEKHYATNVFYHCGHDTYETFIADIISSEDWENVQMQEI